MIKRIKFLFIFFVLIFASLIVRLFYWQIIRGADLSKEAKLQYQSVEHVSAPRGNILSTDGSWLAASSQGFLIYADKKEIKEPLYKVAQKIAPLLDYDIDLLYKNLANPEVVWIPLKHKVDIDIKRNIEALNIKGIGYSDEDIRVYPESSSAAQVLGFVGYDDNGDDKGYFGLEGFYDTALKGKEGFLAGDTDARGNFLLTQNNTEVSAIGGIDLKTSIDKTIQLIVEKKLKEGIEAYGASAGTVVIMNPVNGEIMAMTSLPTYDPQYYYKFEGELYKNPVISDSFEPGSIFKPIIMASAIDSQLIDSETICDICAAPVKVDKYFIETWNNKYRANETMTDVIIHSDNVGMTFVGFKLGSDRLYDYLTKFGIGKSTQIDLQGEENPGLREKGKWNVVDLATASFGQGVAVTPIQMINALAVIANQGIKVKPHVLVRMVKDSWSSAIKISQGERVISKEAADEITQMMVSAVKDGEAKWAAPKGFKIAGKTGTAQIPVAGHYESKKTIASFIGFAPADKPKFVMLVILKEPKSSQWGSETAAPLWFNISRELFPYLKIQPES